MILINGMDMPKSCFCCPMREWHIVHGEKITSCRAAVMLIKDEDDKPDWCPIIEIPQHGDLIDVDAIMRLFYVRSRDGKVIGMFPSVDISVIKNAPVVIPADKDGAN